MQTRDPVFDNLVDELDEIEKRLVRFNYMLVIYRSLETVFRIKNKNWKRDFLNSDYLIFLIGPSNDDDFQKEDVPRDQDSPPQESRRTE